MSKSEKRFFTLNNNFIKKEENKILLLFNEINKQTTYDEVALKKVINSSGYHNYKKILFENILTSLFAFNSKKSFDKKVLYELGKAQVLIDVYMHAEAYKKIKLLIKEAKKRNKKEVLLELYRYLHDILVVLVNKDTDKLEELLETEETIIILAEILKQTTLYKKTMLEIRIAQRNQIKESRETKITTIKKIARESPHLHQNLEEVMVEILPMHVYIKALVYTFSLEYEKCYLLLTKYFSSIKPQDVSMEHILNLKSLGIFLQVLISLEKTEEFKDTYNLFTFQEEKIQTEALYAILILKIRYIEAIVKIDFTDWDEEEFLSIKNYIETSDKKIIYKSVLYTKYRFMEFHFQNGNYQEAVKVIDLNLFEENKSQLQNYIYGIYHCLIFSYMELNNFLLVSKFLRSLKYQLKTKDASHFYQKEILEIIIKINNKWLKQPKALFIKLLQLTQSEDAHLYLNSKVLERYAQKKIASFS